MDMEVENIYRYLVPVRGVDQLLVPESYRVKKGKWCVCECVRRAAVVNVWCQGGWV